MTIPSNASYSIISIYDFCEDAEAVIENKLREFASMYSYDYICSTDNLVFTLKPVDRFPYVRNSFRPQIDISFYPNANHTVVEISLSLPYPTRIMISIMYVVLFVFLGAVLSTFFIGYTTIVGFLVWCGLFVSITALNILGKKITFHRMMARLQRIFAQLNV